MPVARRPSGALVIGASSGIGRATAVRLAELGIPVVLASRSGSALEVVATECRRHGVTASVVVLDVRDDAAVEAAVSSAADTFGRDLAVIHAAAVVAYGLFEEVPPDLMSSVVDTNVLGTVSVARSALNAFRRTGGGHLVVIGSLLGEIAVPYMSAYVLSKWAVHGLVRTVQVETREREGVEVSLVAPGGIDTPVYRRAATVLGRHGKPPPPVATAEDVADAVVRVLARPRRLRHVVGTNPVVVAGFRTAPGVFDRLVTPLMRTFGLDEWTGLPPDPGNVLEPRHGPPGTDIPDPAPQEPAMTDDKMSHLPRVSRSVAAPAQAVWDVLADGWQYATWVVGASRVRAVDDAWPLPGAELHHSVGVWPALLSDTTSSEEAREPARLVLTARGWPLGEARVQIEVVPDGPQSCTVSIAEDASSGPGLLVPLPARQAMILPRNREALRRLGLVAEGRHRQELTAP